MTQQAAPRATRQRTAVLEVLQDATDFLSAQELHARLRTDGHSVGLSTVYRTLQSLAGTAEVDVVVAADGEARYRSCSSEHHHHLICRRCGRTEEVRNPMVESWAARIGADHGFSAVTHTLEVFGLCPRCTTERAGPA